MSFWGNSEVVREKGDAPSRLLRILRQGRSFLSGCERITQLLPANRAFGKNLYFIVVITQIP
jgi:hypothetical protein